MKAAIGVAQWVDVEGTIVPVVPAAWDVHPEDNGWVSIWPLGRETRPGVYVHARAMAVDGANAAFVICGANAVVRALADRCNRVWTISELRNDSSLLAQRVKNAWIETRDSDGLPELRATIAGFDFTVLIETSESVY